MASETRFEAEWVIKQHRDKYGEWNPDLEEYGCAYYATRELAERGAIRSGKRAGECDWIGVTEQRYVSDEPLVWKWVDVRRWTGDWSGLGDSCTYYQNDDALAS